MTERKKGVETTGDESGPGVNRNSLHSDFPLNIFTQTIMHLVPPRPFPPLKLNINKLNQASCRFRGSKYARK